MNQNTRHLPYNFLQKSKYLLGTMAPRFPLRDNANITLLYSFVFSQATLWNSLNQAPNLGGGGDLAFRNCESDFVLDFSFLNNSK